MNTKMHILIYSYIMQHIKITNQNQHTQNEHFQHASLSFHEIKLMLMKSIIAATTQTEKISKIVIPIRE